MSTQKYKIGSGSYHPELDRQSRGFPRRFNKITYAFITLVLTSGASFILGLLSFSGIFALWPVVPLAIGALVLSVVYEGEIYFQNITSALDKLFNPNYIKMELARSYLQSYFPLSIPREQWPRFFRKYESALHRLHVLRYQPLSAEIKHKKRLTENKLHALEVIFLEQLAAPPHQPITSISKEKQALRRYLIEYRVTSEQGELIVESLLQKFQDSLQKKQTLRHLVQVFSILMVIFMGGGTAYLLGATLPVIPFFSVISLARWSMFILPLAVISGLAYGLLTYNTMTNIIGHGTLHGWYVKFVHEIKAHGLTVRNGFMMIMAIVLVALSLILTCCTAGTWLAIVRASRPVFSWMINIPKWVVNIITPLMTSLSSLAFNIENTSESLEILNDITQDSKHGPSYITAVFKREIKALCIRENAAQLLNPFRFILAFSITPLRILLFLGHIVIVGIISSRAPGIPKMWASLFGIVTKGFVEAHYFINNISINQCDTQFLLSERMDCRKNRINRLDLPTRLLMYAVFPCYILASIWDSLFSQFNTHDRRLSFSQAFQKQWGIK